MEFRRIARAPRAAASEERLDTLNKALGLWCGPLFADGPEWIRTDPLVRQWEDTRITMALELADTALEAGKAELALDHLERMAAESPYEERLHARLLMLLRACGRRAEALLRYEMVRHRLADDLGVGPGRALTEVHTQLLREPRPVLRALPPKAGDLVVGTLEAMVALPHMRALLAEMRIRYPALAIKVRHLDFVEQVNALPRGEVDVVVLYLPVPAGVEVEPLAVERRVIAVSETHPFATRDRVTLADLADQAVVSVSQAVPEEWRSFWAVDPRPDGTRVTFTDDEASNLEALFSAAALGPNITIVPAACRELYPRPGIVYVDVTDMAPITSVLAWLPGRESPAVTALVREARRQREETLTGGTDRPDGCDACDECGAEVLPAS
ncbi:LysR substrate-binding domain-containing protein [Streptomyces sp. NBC_01498]|uniref:BTAD domain-containing putative transcriptional regulator n=1 Tax=Streptomyces sp. NBC_01498 TaxID=2975870 RepID=UPI002E7B92FE|nr:BTAD domain-containing putative transcriptional regulator [Streptomyces sp. NBC_01498]WTL28202.1 LysR substrate-binding domain-containing protein [Streptomyces sp. NBC_01498]